MLAAHLTFSDTSHGFKIIVLGGTGEFAGVRGFAEIRDLPSGASNIEFHLLT